MNHFLPYLYGRHFDVITDHQALTSVLTSKTLNRRLHGMVLKLMQFDMNIIYRPGSSNQNADGVSRQAWSDEVAGEQQDGIKDIPVRVGEPRGVWERLFRKLSRT